MASTNQFVKRMNDYKKCMRILNCANHIYLDEIDNFEFKQISKYNKSKNLYNKITHDFKLVNELLDKQDLLNAATILRTLYENIIYIIAKSYDKKLNITLNTLPRDLRPILENNCKEIDQKTYKSCNVVLDNKKIIITSEIDLNSEVAKEYLATVSLNDVKENYADTPYTCK